MLKYIIKPIIFVLCISLLIQGCSSYSFLSKENLRLESLSEENIVVTLIDGSVIESDYNRHVYTTDRADFIYGIGKWKHEFSAETPFVGKLERSFIDSLKIDEYGPEGSYLCYLSGGTVISFSKENFVIVASDQPPGLWCTGIMTVNKTESRFSGRIPEELIKDIRIKKENILGTIALVTGGVLLIAVLFAPKGNGFGWNGLW